MDWQVIFQIIIGSSIAIGFVIWVENVKKPNLKLKIEDPIDVEYPKNRPAKNTRYLRLFVENESLPFLARWLSRGAAVRCCGVISFHHLDGQDVFGRSMQGRWVRSHEPVPIQAFAKGLPTINIIDPVRLSPEMYRDVHAGTVEKLDIAARFDDDVNCYGWSNDNYFSNPVWRDPNWKLEHRRYLVHVIVTSSGSACRGLFRLINDVPKSDFRLEKALPEDYKKIDLASK